MPDLTEVLMYHCITAEEWECKVPSSKGDTTYTVSFGRHHKNPNVQFDYSCTCKGYKFGKGKICSHIEKVHLQRCGWSQFVDGGEPVNGRCPKCGREVIAQRYGV